MSWCTWSRCSDMTVMVHPVRPVADRVELRSGRRRDHADRATASHCSSVRPCHSSSRNMTLPARRGLLALLQQPMVVFVDVSAARTLDRLELGEQNLIVRR